MSATAPLVSIVLGTRPEAIKLAPVILAFQRDPGFRTRVVLTGQHREMVAQVMDLFGLTPDRDLALMAPKQTLTHVTCAALQGLREEFLEHRPDLVLVQGDTTTAFASALAAFYEQIPVGHVEAGLRTDNLLDPFPEEANRRLISQVAQLHFAPTSVSEANLKASGVVGQILVTGNTVIDALLLMAASAPLPQVPGLDWERQRVILATVHRRENWGERLTSIGEGFRQLLDRHPDTALLLPLHRNPTVREPLQELLGDHPRAHLCEPLDYDELVGAIRGCTLLLSDSGGLQEEAPALGKPVLVLRRTTERPEAVTAGTARLIGTDRESIVDEASRLLDDPQAYAAMAQAHNPFGDGQASGRILEASRNFLSGGRS
ncbi:UDP-N-acetylglucosamine 2-epimerase (non-hydrolyzing) [Synechococcus sp. Cruz-9H2]|uniref:non-hydrolyzing UDP-N-acetylglucosamine 2-epimerase n=1 Tax=unclassified Synechococcus TaxID=2626047 RepID=UPI0020CF08A9|nr:MULTISPECIES: UDP-N-acetylglucosamine 2-epimerase (non-hydrolyzing) [unclassified Synechococcus]MCP9818678.1 UDP-N-acetylglucosamine 2-epimerase (non-hydrolyzing) [Synechococcus sp. Cruz-9H2]MCP9842908.1 UDP-N-acetylglucosamine 2-epimerase (non-hydrolyzing) [Synechococcus sp. Edmonson 11F2]MCP9855933.1 UDP-N-acetylglucosamine 2-epimerase (non-hydrolyzing) [Synechococcus sp. Cruz-9C9]MCP9862180.1 UDP-N-acetylglucosamine 2-epimerase (non-hydrolyzing) [Synechococcus sp. Cruz-7E5]MCP9869451.1 U